MKTIPLNSLLFKSLVLSFFTIFSFLSTCLGQTVSKPGTSSNYVQYSTTQGFIQESSTYYTYNSAGLVTEILDKTFPSNQNLTKKTFTYDTFGNEIAATSSDWVNGGWQGWNIRFLLTYDTNNRVLEKIGQSLINGNWANADKIVNTYSNGILSGIEYLTFDTNLNNWRSIYRKINFVWHKANEPVAYVYQIKSNNNWENYLKYNAVFDSRGGYTAITEKWQNNGWVNDSREINTKDLLGNTVYLKKEFWKNSTWNFNAETYLPIIYSPNQDILEQSFSTSCIACTPGPPTKKVYSNFSYFTITGLKNDIPQEITANVYPNPSSGTLYIELLENTKLAQTQLSDLTGKVILTQEFKDGKQFQLDINKLSAGIYLLKFETEKGIYVRKVFKN